MSNQLTIEVYNNIASGAPPIQVIETEISSSSIFVQALEDVAPINVQVYESTTSGTFPIQVIQSEFTGVPIYIQVQEDYAPVQSVNGKIGWVVIDKNDVGLSNVENVSILGVSGNIQNQINNLDNIYASDVQLSATGQFLNQKIDNLSGYTNTNFYPRSNPSGFITGVDLSSYVTGSVVRPSETGQFYPRSNPSGFITGVDLSAYVTKSSGAFTNRPTVNGTGVLLSGEVAGLPTTILYTTGNQIKSGRLIIGNDAISIVDPNSQYTLSLQTNSPATWLEILNNSGANKGVFFGIQDNDFEQYNWQGGDITFFTAENVEAGYARLTIKNDGKVGIGTSSPSEKLEVAGNIKASGASFNHRPTVNGSGVLLSGEAYPSNNPSGFITGVNLSSYATIANLNAVSGALQTQINNISGGGSITGDYYPNSNPSGFITGVDLSTYATNSNLFLTGQNLDNKINSLSGYVEEENILVFTAELPSGQESVFLTYPFSLGTSPSSITCSFQNTVDNVIYNYIIGQITQSGFHANFSDILSNSGYLLKVNVKK